MSNIWEKFDKSIDTEGLKKDLKEIEENSGDFGEVPLGKYEVAIEKLEPTVSKSGRPMVTCWMRILEGEYKGQMIFYNQVIDIGYGLHNANEFLRSLDSGHEIKFENMRQYAELIMDIYEAVDGKLEYALEYGKNNKGYNTYKITDVFEV